MIHGGEREGFAVKFLYFLRNSLFAKRNLFASFMVAEPTNNTGVLHARTHVEKQNDRVGNLETNRREEIIGRKDQESQGE
jgi:hypothetical protein